MQSADTLPIGDEMPPEQEESEVITDPGPPPQVMVKPGWRTSEGVIVGLFTFTLTILSFFNRISPSTAQDWSDKFAIAVNNFWPFLLQIPVLWHYFTSRGKLKSNATLANAALLNPMIPNKLTNGNMRALGLMGGGGLGDILGRIGGGSGAKDPNTYVGLSRIIGKLSGGRLGRTIDSITSGGSEEPLTNPKELEQALTLIVEEIETLKEVTVSIWNRFPNDAEAGVRVRGYDAIIRQIKGSERQSDR